MTFFYSPGFFPHFLLTFLTPQKILPILHLMPPYIFSLHQGGKILKHTGQKSKLLGGGGDGGQILGRGDISHQRPRVCSPVSRVKFLPENSYPELLLCILRKCMFRPVMYSGLCHILRSEYRIETIELRYTFYFPLIEILHSSNMAQIYGYRMRQQTASTFYSPKKTNERNIYVENCRMRQKV